MPSMEKIVDEVFEGIIQAQKRYRKMSGGCWLWEAPEYFLTTSIANRISKLSALYVTLEYNVRQAINDGGGLSPGQPPHAMKIDGRFDILLWNGESPKIPIEVKNKGWIEEDIDKICAVLNRCSEKNTIRDGIVCFSTAWCSARKAPDTVKNRLSKNKQLIESYVAEYEDLKLKQHKMRCVCEDEDSENAEGAGIFHIQRRVRP